MDKSIETAEEKAKALAGQKVRQRRKLLGMTQSQLAKAVGIRFQQVQKYESGANSMTLQRALSIAEALNCSILDLVEPNPVFDRERSDPLQNPYAIRAARAVANLPPRLAVPIVNMAEDIGPNGKKSEEGAAA